LRHAPNATGKGIQHRKPRIRNVLGLCFIDANNKPGAL
jgi:hypothetical protein